MTPPSFPIPSPVLFGDGTAGAWLGGDGGFLVRSSPGRYLLFYGDNYINRNPGATGRAGSVIVGNVVGVAAASGGGWATRLYAAGTAGRPLSTFDDATNAALDTRVDGQKAFMYNGKLYVMLVRADNKSAGYSPVGSAVARVDNPLDPPPAWKTDYLHLWTGRPIFGTEAFPVGPFLRLLGSAGDGRLYPALLPLAALEICPDGGDLAGALSYWNGADWLPGATGKDAAPCGIVTASGVSVWLDEGLTDPATGKKGVWCALYLDTTTEGGWPAVLTMAVGADFRGPVWTRRRVGAFPEMVGDGGALYNPDNCVYLPKYLSDFPPGRGRALVSYSVGSMSAHKNNYKRQMVDNSCYCVVSRPFALPFA